MSFGDPPGFKRVDHLGQRVFYLTIPDPTEKEESFLKFTNVSQIRPHLSHRVMVNKEQLARQLKVLKIIG